MSELTTASPSPSEAMNSLFTRLALHTHNPEHPTTSATSDLTWSSCSYYDSDGYNCAGLRLAKIKGELDLESNYLARLLLNLTLSSPFEITIHHVTDYTDKTRVLTVTEESKRQVRADLLKLLCGNLYDLKCIPRDKKIDLFKASLINNGLLAQIISHPRFPQEDLLPFLKNIPKGSFADVYLANPDSPTLKNFISRLVLTASDFIGKDIDPALIVMMIYSPEFSSLDRGIQKEYMTFYLKNAQRLQAIAVKMGLPAFLSLESTLRPKERSSITPFMESFFGSLTREEQDSFLLLCLSTQTAADLTVLQYLFENDSTNQRRDPFWGNYILREQRSFSQNVLVMLLLEKNSRGESFLSYVENSCCMRGITPRDSDTFVSLVRVLNAQPPMIAAQLINDPRWLDYLTPTTMPYNIARATAPDSDFRMRYHAINALTPSHLSGRADHIAILQTALLSWDADYFLELVSLGWNFADNIDAFTSILFPARTQKTEDALLEPIKKRNAFFERISPFLITLYRTEPLSLKKLLATWAYDLVTAYINFKQLGLKRYQTPDKLHQIDLIASRAREATSDSDFYLRLSAAVKEWLKETPMLSFRASHKEVLFQPLSAFLDALNDFIIKLTGENLGLELSQKLSAIPLETSKLRGVLLSERAQAEAALLRQYETGLLAHSNQAQKRDLLWMGIELVQRTLSHYSSPSATLFKQEFNRWIEPADGAEVDLNQPETIFTLALIIHQYDASAVLEPAVSFILKICHALYPVIPGNKHDYNQQTALFGMSSFDRRSQGITLRDSLWKRSIRLAPELPALESAPAGAGSGAGAAMSTKVTSSAEQWFIRGSIFYPLVEAKSATPSAPPADPFATASAPPLKAGGAFGSFFPSSPARQATTDEEKKRAVSALVEQTFGGDAQEALRTLMALYPQMRGQDYSSASDSEEDAEDSFAASAPPFSSKKEV